jgi:DNA recombination protein RmuC
VRGAARPLREAEKAHAAADERGKQSELLRLALSEVTRERDDAMQRLAELQADARNFETRMQEMVAAKEALSAQFSEIGSKLLNDVQRQFLERADQRFTQASEKSEAQLKALLQPVETTLKQYDEKLSLIEKDRAGSYGELREAVRLLHAGHSQVRDETRNLVNALRSSPKARGRWGEQSLKNVLEQAGLSPYADFQTEVSVDTGEGRLRPDVIVRLPGGRKLIIDAKCSLNAFLDANDCVDDVTRLSHLKNHAQSIRNHALQLGSKAYWELFGDAADYVVMYIPGEHFLTAALEQDDGLWGWAFERRVLLATPTNLVAIARTVASVWRQEKLAEQAAEIAKLGKELHNRIATMGEHVRKLGQNLERANGAYNSFVGSLEGQVMSQAKRFEALEVAGGSREIEPLPMVESSPRPLTKLIADLPAAAE